MTPEAIFVLAVLVAALILFVTELASVDLVGLFVLVALMLGPPLTPGEALAGFANEALITIAAMFVLSTGLIRSGALDSLTRLMFELSGGRAKPMVALVMIAVAVSSAFVNNTPIVVIFLPIVLSVAGTFGIAPSKLLIPMSFASILGGTCTLIGTSTNLLVAQAAAESPARMTIGMFDITLPGIIFAVVGFAFMATAGKGLLPNRATVTDTLRGGRIREFVTEILFPEGSPLVGRSYQEVLGKSSGVSPLMLIRGDDVIFSPFIKDPRAQFIRAGDIVLLKGEPGAINALLERDGITLPPELGDLIAHQGVGKAVTMVELVIIPNSPLQGRTIAGSDFSRKHAGAAAIAVLRHDEHMRKRVSEIRLRLGDTLLVVCDEKCLDELRTSQDFLVLEGVADSVKRLDKAPMALGIMGLVVILGALNLPGLPISTLALSGVLLMVLTGVTPLRLAYASVDMSIMLMIAGMLALGKALEATHLVAMASDLLVGSLHAYGPLAVLGGIYLTATILTSLISNSAVAVLITPIAIETALAMGYEPAPFVFATLFGASASFATPIGYQTNLFVYAPGNYRFVDYLRIGVPLNILFLVVALLVIPWWWPLQALAS